MTRYADRKAQIRAEMAQFPGMTYSEATQRLDAARPAGPEPAVPAVRATPRIRRADPGQLRRLLVDATKALRTVPVSAPPVVRLVRAWGGIVVAGHVSDLLRDHAVPARDANTEELSGGRPFLPTTVEVFLLMVGWLALGAYFAHAERSRVAWRIVTFFIGLAAVTLCVLALIAFVIPAGISLYDYTVGKVVLYYLVQLVIFPGLNGAVGYLAYRHMRRSRGALRAALIVTTASLWLLNPMLVVRFVEVWGRYRGIRVPGGDATLGGHVFRRRHSVVRQLHRGSYRAPDQTIGRHASRAA